MTILLLSPYRPDTPPALLTQAAALRDALIAATPEPVEVAARPIDGRLLPEQPKYGPHATARNAMIDAFLRPEHRWVLWVDIDLIAYPATFAIEAMARNPLGITGCIPLLDHLNRRLYDIGGFLDWDGSPGRPDHPWFDQPGPAYDLQSVGCLYLIPAWLYRAPVGLRYRPDGPVYGVEHPSVCQGALRHGVKIRAYDDLTAVHAWLPDYGRMPQ